MTLIRNYTLFVEIWSSLKANCTEVTAAKCQTHKCSHRNLAIWYIAYMEYSQKFLR